MNDLKNLTSLIEKEAAEYREKAISDAAAEVEKIRERYNNEADKIRAEYKDKADLLIKRSETGTAAAVAMHNRNMILETKNALIDRVMDIARQKLIGLDAHKRAELYSNFAKQVFEDNSDGELILCECDASSAQFYLDAVNSAARECGKPMLKLSEKVSDGECGIIIAYGQLEYNCMIDSIIKSEYRELSKYAVRVLFS